LKEVTAQELKKIDPRRFKKEYADWSMHAADWDWTDFEQDECKKELALEGIHVDSLYWQVAFSQGDGASFDGFVNIRDWMLGVKADEELTYAEKYPALFCAAKQDGSFMRVRTSNRGVYLHIDMRENWQGTRAEGIFTGLDDATWEELVEGQASDACLDEDIRLHCQNRMNEFYRTLRGEYEHLTSEESFIESCDCNGVTFEIEEEEHEV
jgi:hypothetical protein